MKFKSNQYFKFIIKLKTDPSSYLCAIGIDNSIPDGHVIRYEDSNNTYKENDRIVEQFLSIQSFLWPDFSDTKGVTIKNIVMRRTPNIVFGKYYYTNQDTLLDLFCTAGVRESTIKRFFK